MIMEMLAFMRVAAGFGGGGITAFHPGLPWADTDGQPIKAHSAGLLPGLQEEFYWYGADNYTRCAAQS